MELAGQARQFALPMLVAIVVATAAARALKKRSVYEARLSNNEVAERLRAGEGDLAES
jgi:H+/Cl- antiporter ClcA